MTTVWKHRVSTADSWGQWSVQTGVQALMVSEGCGQIFGEAQLTLDAGLGYEPNGVIISFIQPEGMVTGRWVRIEIQDPEDGSWSDLWYGVLATSNIQPDGGPRLSGRFSWIAYGLSYALDQVAITRGWELAYDTTVIDPGYFPIINERRYGDRCASPVTVNGRSVYVHDRSSVGDSWTAQDLLELILAGCAQPQIAGSGSPSGALEWVLGPALDDRLAWRVPRLDLHGMTVFEAMNAICNPARGLTWSVVVTGGQAVVGVQSVSPEAITVSQAGGGTITLPAATGMSVVNTDGDPFIGEVGIKEDSDQYDLIQVEGARPWYAMTLWMTVGDVTSALIPDGWEVDDAPGPDESTWIWRAFKLNPEWTGQQWNQPGEGLRPTLVWDAAGAGGQREFGGTHPPVEALEVTRELPYGQGFTTIAETGRESARVIVGTGIDDWYDWSDEWEVSTDSRGRIVLGRDWRTAEALKAEMDEGKTLLVTIGVRDWKPLMLAWNRQGGPRDTPRVMLRRDPNLELWQCLVGTVLGAPYGTLTLETETRTIDLHQTTSIASVLATLRARYGGTGGTASWTDRGRLDFSGDLAPGTMIRSIVSGGKTWTINATITRRTWDLTMQGYGTTYVSERLIAGLGGSP
jgi:hypothetical protein